MAGRKSRQYFSLSNKKVHILQLLQNLFYSGFLTAECLAKTQKNFRALKIQLKTTEILFTLQGADNFN